MTRKTCVFITVLLLTLAIPVSRHLIDQDVVVRACIKLSERIDGEGSGSTTARCQCFDNASRRYLDDRSYVLLEEASRQVDDGSPNAAREMSIWQTNQQQLDALDIASSIADFALLARKVPRVCN